MQHLLKFLQKQRGHITMGYRYQNKKLPLDKPFTDKDGTKYPANWLRLSTQQQRDQVPGGAITWVPD